MRRLSILLTAFLLLLTFIVFSQAGSRRQSIYFDNADFQLTARSRITIDSLLASLSEFYLQKIIVTGNTDNVGHADFNKKLSAQRVDATKSYLLGKGLQDTLFKTLAFGEEKPRSRNETAEGKQANRRVDIDIYYFSEPESTSSIWDLFKQVERKPQEFLIDNSRDTAIRGEEGTVIYIKANTFKLDNKCKNSPVLFKLKEDFSPSNMLLDNLSTTSNGKLLQTEGMLYTEALDCNRKKVLVNRGKDLIVYQPSGQLNPNAKIFSGNRTAHDSVMNWTLNTNPELRQFTLQQLDCCYDYILGCRNGCSRCRFFFCRISRIGEPFKGMFSQSVRDANRQLRLCQRSLRQGRRSSRKAARDSRRAQRRRSNDATPASNPFVPVPVVPAVTSRPTTQVVSTAKCEELNKLYQKYHVDNNAALIYALNKTLLDSFKVKTLVELQDTLDRLKIYKLELAFKDSTISFEEYSYYVYNSSRLGWSNVDVFASYDPKELVKLKVDLKAGKDTDCKLVYEDRQYVIPATSEEKKYIFDKVPRGEKAWIVAVRYRDQQPMLYMEEIVVEKGTYPVAFKKVSLEELKARLKLLDSSWRKP